jgi:large subunit ribosomal protein L23
VILAPVVTEKSTQGAEYNQLTFRVTRDATKREIKAGIEELFGVKVTKVNTLNMRGKIKRFRGRLGKRADYKKAIVTLAEGERIDITTGI